MTEEIIIWFITTIGTTAITAVITFFKTKRSAERSRRLDDEVKAKAVQDGVQCLLRAEIIRSYEKYMELGFCPIYAKEALSKMYRAYHALDGNDVATEMYEAIMELPTENPDLK